jgi:hypothetical protein
MKPVLVRAKPASDDFGDAGRVESDAADAVGAQKPGLVSVEDAVPKIARET